jgi:hypothetical protein
MSTKKNIGNGNGILAALMALVAGLKEGERIAVILRHGSRKEHKSLPNDTICAESWDEISKLGALIRKAGIKLAKIVTSHRGRAVMAACALGEGNAEKEESVAPFCTDESLGDASNDVSNGGPEAIKEYKKTAAASGIPAEQATLDPSCDEAVQLYTWERANGYARCISTRMKLSDGQPIAFVAHGGFSEVALQMLLHPTARRLDQLGQPEKWLEMGGAAVAVFNKTGDCVKVVYL